MNHISEIKVNVYVLNICNPDFIGFRGIRYVNGDRLSHYKLLRFAPKAKYAKDLSDGKKRKTGA
jgi:hypothetical protein